MPFDDDELIISNDNYGVEISPSGRAHCRGCNNFIEKGAKRLWIDGPLVWYRSQKFLYCLDCGLKVIEIHYITIEKVFKELKQAKKEERRINKKFNY